MTLSAAGGEPCIQPRAQGSQSSAAGNVGKVLGCVMRNFQYKQGQTNGGPANIMGRLTQGTCQWEGGRIFGILVYS
jgi:hypothetical protein